MGWSFGQGSALQAHLRAPPCLARDELMKRARASTAAPLDREGLRASDARVAERVHVDRVVARGQAVARTRD